ncbi:hypothetical protein LXL04_018468 [Taraxacum kok-saghyz]
MVVMRLLVDGRVAPKAINGSFRDTIVDVLMPVFLRLLMLMEVEGVGVGEWVSHCVDSVGVCGCRRDIDGGKRRVEKGVIKGGHKGVHGGGGDIRYLKIRLFSKGREVQICVDKQEDDYIDTIQSRDEQLDRGTGTGTGTKTRTLIKEKRFVLSTLLEMILEPHPEGHEPNYLPTQQREENTVRLKEVPIKVCAFVWKAMIGKIPSFTALSRVASPYLLVFVNFAAWRMKTAITSLSDALSQLRFRNESSIGATSLTRTLWWIWKAQNNRTFNKLDLSPMKVADNIQSSVFQSGWSEIGIENIIR